MRRLVRRILVAISEILLRVIPRKNHALLSGWPADEGNIVEIARELIVAGHPFVWLDPPSPNRLMSLQIFPTSKVRFLPKRSLRGFAAFVSARCVFVTHGLYGNPRPVPHKPIVNLWHGDGPKKEGHQGEGGRSTVPATYLVSSSSVFATYRAGELGTPSTGIVLLGLPRQEQLIRPATPPLLETIGIDSQKPFVVWLPTYRVSTGTGLVKGWTDGTGEDLSTQFETVLRELVELDIQVAVKKHPLDAIQPKVAGLITLSDAMIADAGLTLYGILGASSGLITDYSSVWVDYLVLDRPVGFLVPDEHEYTDSRGLFPSDVMDHLPGLKLDSSNNIRMFANDVVGQNQTSNLRVQARKKFGLVPLNRPALNLIDFLTSAGHLTETE